jgi:F-type H+-transporting ATPase subunit b
MMRRLVAVALFVCALAATPATAQEPAGASPEGGAGFPGADVNEPEHDGIVNWWSWDYGPSAHDPSHRHWPPPFGFALVNFGIFFAIMWKLAANPLRTYVFARHERIRKDLDEAARLHREAQTHLNEYQTRIAGAEAEITRVVDEIRKEAEAEKARVIAAAEEQAVRLKAEAERQIKAEIERARLELRRGVIDAAVALADRLMRENIGADDQRKLAERYVAGVEQSAPTPTPAKRFS